MKTMTCQSSSQTKEATSSEFPLEVSNECNLRTYVCCIPYIRKENAEKKRKENC